MECTVTGNTVFDSSNEDVIKLIPSSDELQLNINKIKIVLDKNEVTTKLKEEPIDLEKINKESFLHKYDKKKECTSTALVKLQDVCRSSVTNHDSISWDTLDVSTSDLEKPVEEMALDKMSNKNNELLSSEKICEEISEILKQSHKSPEIRLSPHTPYDTDENTTQLRFEEYEVSDEKIDKDQTDNILTRTTEHATTVSPDHDFLYEKSYLFPINKTLKHHVTPQPCPTAKAEQFNGNDINLNHIFMKSETLPSVVEESSLDSGIVSLDEPEASSSAPSSDNEVGSPLILKKAITGSHRKRLQTCVSGSLSKRPKQDHEKSVTFEGVTIYYFPRKQSFVTVPSQGGSTLGMSLHHTHTKELTLDQHKRALASHHRQVMKEHARQQEIKEKIKELKESNPDLDTNELMLMITGVNNEEDFSESSSDEDYEEEKDFSDDDEEDDDNFFLQPIPTKKRRLLLRMAGVQKIDAEEKLTNKYTRESREVCGCDCEGTCLPANCQCALAGIPCQVDRESFPCGCVSSGCHNDSGRVEFDSDRVTSHYFQTMRRLRLEAMGAFHTSTTPQVVKSPHKSPYVSPTGDGKGAARAWFKPVTNQPSSQASAEFQHCLQQSYLEDLEQSPAPTPPTSGTWSTSHGCDSFASPIPTPRGGASDSLGGSFIESLEIAQPIQDRSFLEGSLHNDLNSNLIVSENNGLAYHVPQPVSTVTSSPVKTYLDNSCGDFGSSFSTADSGFDSEFASDIFSCGGFNPSKKTCKLDPIASFLPLNQSSSKLSEDPINFAHPCNPLQVVGRSINSAQFGGDGELSSKSSVPIAGSSDE